MKKQHFIDYINAKNERLIKINEEKSQFIEELLSIKPNNNIIYCIDSSPSEYERVVPTHYFVGTNIYDKICEVMNKYNIKDFEVYPLELVNRMEYEHLFNYKNYIIKKQN